MESEVGEDNSYLTEHYTSSGGNAGKMERVHSTPVDRSYIHHEAQKGCRLFNGVEQQLEHESSDIESNHVSNSSSIVFGQEQENKQDTDIVGETQENVGKDDPLVVHKINSTRETHSNALFDDECVEQASESFLQTQDLSQNNSVHSGCISGLAATEQGSVAVNSEVDFVKNMNGTGRDEQGSLAVNSDINVNISCRNEQASGDVNSEIDFDRSVDGTGEGHVSSQQENTSSMLGLSDHVQSAAAPYDGGTPVAHSILHHTHEKQIDQTVSWPGGGSSLQVHGDVNTSQNASEHHHPSSVTEPPASEHHHPSSVTEPPASEHHHPSSVTEPPASEHHHPSSVTEPPASEHHHPSSVTEPPASEHHHPSSVTEPPASEHHHPPSVTGPPAEREEDQMHTTSGHPLGEADSGQSELCVVSVRSMAHDLFPEDFASLGNSAAAENNFLHSDSSFVQEKQSQEEPHAAISITALPSIRIKEEPGDLGCAQITQSESEQIISACENLKEANTSQGYGTTSTVITKEGKKRRVKIVVVKGEWRKQKNKVKNKNLVGSGQVLRPNTISQIQNPSSTIKPVPTSPAIPTALFRNVHIKTEPVVEGYPESQLRQSQSLPVSQRGQGVCESLSYSQHQFSDNLLRMTGNSGPSAVSPSLFSSQAGHERSRGKRRGRPPRNRISCEQTSPCEAPQEETDLSWEQYSTSITSNLLTQGVQQRGRGHGRLSKRISHGETSPCRASQERVSSSEDQTSPSATSNLLGKEGYHKGCGRGRGGRQKRISWGQTSPGRVSQGHSSQSESWQEQTTSIPSDPFCQEIPAHCRGRGRGRGKPSSKLSYGQTSSGEASQEHTSSSETSLGQASTIVNSSPFSQKVPFRGRGGTRGRARGYTSSRGASHGQLPTAGMSREQTSYRRSEQTISSVRTFTDSEYVDSEELDSVAEKTALESTFRSCAVSLRRLPSCIGTTGAVNIKTDPQILQELTLLTVSKGSRQRPWVCELCGKAYKTSSARSQHYKVHRGVREHVCTVCGADFMYKSVLTQHYRFVHLKEKPHTCPICGKRFGWSSHLGAHLSRHYEEKPIPCPICHKEFTSLYIKKHIETHSDVRAFKCKICEKEYRSKKGLQEHEKIHSGLKPFKCKECGQKFAYKNSLAIHTRTHTGERPFACPKCPSTFSQSTHLRTHMKGVHKMKSFPSRQRRETVERVFPKPPANISRDQFKLMRHALSHVSLLEKRVLEKKQKPWLATETSTGNNAEEDFLSVHEDKREHFGGRGRNRPGRKRKRGGGRGSPDGRMNAEAEEEPVVSEYTDDIIFDDDGGSTNSVVTTTMHAPRPYDEDDSDTVEMECVPTKQPRIEVGNTGEGCVDDDNV